MTITTRRVLALLCLPLMFLMSSCVRMQASYDIKSVDEINVVMDIGLLKSVADQSDGEYTKDTACNSSDTNEVTPAGNIEGAKLEGYDDGTYVGCRITGTATAANLSTDGSTTVTLVDDVWTFKMDNSGAGSETTPAEAKQMFTDFKFSVTFPGEVLTHSGSSTVEGTTVTWTDPGDMFTTEGIQATARDGSNNLLMYIVIGVVALGLIGGGVVLFVMNDKKKKAAAAAAAQAQQFGWGGQPGQQWSQQPGSQPSASPWQAQPDQQGWGGQPGQQWSQQPGSQPSASPWQAQPDQQGWGQQQPGAQPPANPWQNPPQQY